MLKDVQDFRRRYPLRTRWTITAVVALICGAVVGALFAPQPAGAVSKEIVELQQQVSQLMQGQQDLRSAVDTSGATLKTLVQQSLDAVNQLNGQMSAVQKSVQEVQANSGTRIDTIAQQTQGLSDNLQDVQARVGKLSQQLTDMQSLLQSIDGKISGGVSPGTASSTGPAGTVPTAAPPVAPSISADTLYQNALRDYTSGNYDLSRKEFSDYIQNFPTNDLASNSQFYLGEISYSQSDFKNAIVAYELVLQNYPHSFKLGASLLKRGMAELELGQKAAGTRDLRDVVRRFPGSDEARRAQSKLHEMGVPTTATAR
jgi:tol-pal system protein YbgF